MSHRARRLTGAGLGFLLGLLYGLSLGFADNIFLPGLPLRLDASQVIADAILSGLSAAVAGLVAAWPESSFRGVVGGALMIALFGYLRSLSQQGSGDDLARAVLVFVPTFLPTVVLALPITGLLRLGVNWQFAALSHTGRPRLFYLGRLYLGLVVVGLTAGYLSHMSEAEARALRQIHVLLQKGLAAQAESDLPEPLLRIQNFRARALGAYTLDHTVEVSSDRSFANDVASQTVIVDVLFASGLHFDCLVGEALAEPLCTEK